MPISYPLTPPVQLAAAKISVPMISRKVAVSRSPFTGEQTTYEWPSQYWVATLSTPAMLRETGGADLEAFFNSLHGVVGTFLWSPPHASAPRGTNTQTTIYSALAGQTGNTLSIYGMSPSSTILAGTFFQIGTGASTRLYQIVQDATSDASGNATLTIEPKLRSAPALSQAINLSNPQGIWRLASAPAPTVVGQGGNGAVYESYSISIEEPL